MRLQILASLTALVAWTPSAFSTQGAEGERLYADKALRSVSEAFAEALEARRAGEEAAPTRAGLEEALAELAEEAAINTDFLSSPADLEFALRRGLRFEKTKVKPGKWTEETLSEGRFQRSALELAFRTPRDYGEEKRGEPERLWPLILALPGIDEEPAEHLREHWTSSEILEGAILFSVALPEDPTKWNQVAIEGRPGGLCYALTALRYAAERFQIDFDRVYVAGRGASVETALRLADYGPQLFAAAIGRSGDAGEIAPDNFLNVPVSLTSAGAQARTLQEKAKALGSDSITLEASAEDSQLWSWMLDHPRQTHPEELRIVVGTPFPSRVHWLRVMPIDTTASATATLDPETNTITIESVGISSVTVYLANALLDLDSAVTVVCNGASTSFVPQRNLDTTLALLLDGTSDGDCVYVAEATIPIETIASEDAAGESAQKNAEESARVEPAADSAFLTRLADTKDDLAALYALHEALLGEEQAAQSRVCLKRIIRIDPDHAAARAALGHVGEPGAQFTSAEAKRDYERSQEEREALSRGYLRHKNRWVHPDERALLGRGLERDYETGQWLTAKERGRLENDWARQDLEWIEPKQAGNRDLGLWRIDDEWLETSAANRRRARLDSMWHIPSPLILLHTTVPRDVAEKALPHMQRAVRDLRRVFGREPLLPLEVTLLSNEEQFDRFAFGAPDGRRDATHLGRLHVIHVGFFAESFFELEKRKFRFAGTGVGYWNTDSPYGDLYGVHSARLATGFSYVDQLDPSVKAQKKVRSKGPSEEYYEAFAEEKSFPNWLRYGAAVFAERYFRDDTVGNGEGANPFWARDWSLDNLKKLGGLRPLAELLKFELNPDLQDDGRKLLIEAGLLVSFSVEGISPPVTEALEAFRVALAGERLAPRHFEDWEAALLAHEAELRVYAGE